MHNLKNSSPKCSLLGSTGVCGSLKCVSKPRKRRARASTKETSEVNFMLKGSFWIPAGQQAESNLSRLKQEGTGLQEGELKIHTHTRTDT